MHVVVVKGPDVDQITGQLRGLCMCVQTCWLIIFASVQIFPSCVDQQTQNLVYTKELTGWRSKTTFALLFVIIYYCIITLCLGVSFLQ